MKSNELELSIQQAKLLRAAHGTADFAELWRKIQRERAAQKARNTPWRWPLSVLAAAAALLMATGAALYLVARPLIRAPSFAESEPVQLHLAQSERLIADFRSGISTGAVAPEIPALAENLALMSNGLRLRAVHSDSAMALRLYRLDFVLSEIASYDPAADVELHDLALIEFSLRELALPPEERPSYEPVEPGVSASQLGRRGRQALAQGDYELAEDSFRRMSTSPQDNDSTRSAQFWLAYTLYQRGAVRRDVRALDAASTSLLGYEASAGSAPDVRAAQLRARIYVEQAALGDSNALNVVSELLPAFERQRHVPYGRLVEAIATSTAPLPLRRQAVLAVAVRGDAHAGRILKALVESEADIPSSLRRASISALATQQLASAAWFNNLTTMTIDAAFRSQLSAAVAFAVPARDTPPEAASAAAREMALTPAHAEPAFELRTAVPAAQLGSADPGAILVDDNGRIFISDRSTMLVIGFDSTGDRTITIGAQGRATTARLQPFSRVAAIGLLADTIVVAEGDSNRLTFLSHSGDLLSRRTGPLGIGSIAALYGAGTQLVGASELRRGTGMRRSFFRVSAAGLPDVLPVRDSSEATTMQCAGPDGQSARTVALPFPARGPLRGLTSDGMLVVAVRDSLHLLLFDSSRGGLAASIVAPFDPLQLSNDRWLSETREAVALQCGAAFARPRWEPAIQSLLTDERGRIWMEAIGERGRQLIIVDPPRSAMESLEFPEREFDAAPAVRGNSFYFVGRDGGGRKAILVYARK
jgi:hypothetical protein